MRILIRRHRTAGEEQGRWAFTCLDPLDRTHFDRLVDWTQHFSSFPPRRGPWLLSSPKKSSRKGMFPERSPGLVGQEPKANKAETS